jgi:hypothetical protein
MLMVLSDGMAWRRASDPSFKAEAVLPHVLHMVHCLLVHPPAPSPSLAGSHAWPAEQDSQGSGQ